MISSISKDQCTVVASSFDGNEDLWKPFFTFFFRYWPDCPYPVYLISNFKRFDHSRVTTLTVGTDRKWASNLLMALDQIPSAYIVYLQDDYFLTEKIDTAYIQKLLGY